MSSTGLPKLRVAALALLAACGRAPKVEEPVLRVTFELPGAAHVAEARALVHRLVTAHGHTLALDASEARATGDKVALYLGANDHANYQVMNLEPGAQVYIAVFSVGDTADWMALACQIVVEARRLRPDLRQRRGSMPTKDFLATCASEGKPAAAG